MAALREIVLARIECPKCAATVKVYAQLGVNSDTRERINGEYVVDVGLQGIWVNHDCRPKTEAVEQEPAS